MQEKDQIAELFKDTFSNYEAPVRPELWQQVASQIQTPVVPSVPDGSSVVNMAAATSKVSSAILGWVAGAAVVVSSITGYYIYNNQQNTASDKTVQQQAAPVTETSINQPAVNSEIIAAPSQAATSTQSEKHVNTPVASSNVSENQSTNSEPAQTASENLSTTTSAGQSVSDQKEGAVNTPEKRTDSNTPAKSTVGTSENTENQVVKIKAQAQPASGYAPLQVGFTATANGDQNEWLFGDGSETAKGIQVSHTFEKPGTYLVTYKHTDETGKNFTDLIKIEVLSDLSITDIPNIFTPNGDGVNDEFAVKTSKDVDIEVNIFDKSGKLVHRYTGVDNSWNGKLNNSQNAGEGTYFYVIFATGKNGEKNTQKGTITLKR